MAVDPPNDVSIFVWKLFAFVSKILSFSIITLFCLGFVLSGLFRFYPWTVGYFVFMNHIHFPPYRNFSDLKLHHLSGSNLYLSEGNVTLGVWHLDDTRTKNSDDTAPVFLYIHGAQGSRAAYHRIQLYRNIQKMDCPVVTFDYRGYGDSSGVPSSELDLLEDTAAVYRWTILQYPRRPVFLWAHSLGTGVSVRLVQAIEQAGNTVDGLVLDSPYSSISDVMRLSPLLQAFHQVPSFTESLLEALEEVHVTLNSSDRIRTTKVPLLILHAEDDWVVPVSLGRKLFEVARARPVKTVTEFVEYSAQFKYGHRGIYRDPNLPVIVKNFVQKAAEVKEMLNRSL